MRVSVLHVDLSEKELLCCLQTLQNPAFVKFVPTMLE